MLSTDNGVLDEIATPALLIDGIAMRENVRKMAAFAASAGVALRPHAKTHKSKEIAALQLEAGASGIACATLQEAAALAGAGVRGLMVTSPVMGEDKFAWAARINREHGLTIVVDHPDQIEGLSAAMETGDPKIEVCVDVDVGQARTGVTSLAAGIALANAIHQCPFTLFAGLQGYAGHAQHIVDPDAREMATEAAARMLRDLADELERHKLPARLLSGSGTGTHRQDANGPYNELQVGSYVFMDADYARILDKQGRGPDFQPSLLVLSTVISANRPGQVTVDAGTKTLATNGPPPVILRGVPPGSTFRFGGDEHGILDIPTGCAAPALGTRVLIGATHCDPTVNLHTRYIVVTGNDLEQWPIIGRHGS